MKPDMLFGQRGKHDLVGLNLTYDEAEAFVNARMGKQVSEVLIVWFRDGIAECTHGYCKASR